jgi:Putative binding domain, N-terminal/Viral BACON domain
MRRSTIVVLIGLTIVAATCSDSPTEPQPVCSFTIAPSSQGFGADGGSGTVTVTTASGCTWNATSSVNWITLTGGASGSGPGSVTYSTTANTSVDARNGALTIGGQMHAVNQSGRPAPTCTYEISPAGLEIRADGDTGSFTVNTAAECAWTATSQESWVQIMSGGQGTGSGTVQFSVSRNPDIPERTAMIAVADRTFSVRQRGDVSMCEYRVTPVEFSPCMPEGTVSATLTTQDACPWTAAPAESWLDAPSGDSGTGSTTINVSFSSNYDAPRTGVIMVRWPTATAGQNLRIAQAGCTYGVSQSAFSFSANAGSGTFQVVQQSIPIVCGGPLQDACVWTASSTVPWITITPGMPQRGDNPVNFTVAANEGSQARTGQIRVRDRTVTITQAGR